MGAFPLGWLREQHCSEEEVQEFLPKKLETSMVLTLPDRKRRKSKAAEPNQLDYLSLRASPFPSIRR